MSSPSSSNAQRELQDLGFTFNPQMPYELETMFPKRQGWGAKGEIKRKQKLVQQVEPLLTRMIKPGERVLYVAHGVQYKFSEQYFMGVWAMLINQTVFVLTNVRLILIHANTKGSPRHTYWLIFYNQIRKFKSSWSGQVALDLVDGTKLRFTGFRGLDKKNMPALFQQAVAQYQELGFNPQSTQSRENLCSECLEVVPKQQYECAHCGQTFWKPSEIALRSLVVPSWGDLIMGHISFAVVEMLGYAVTWLILIMALANSVKDPEAIFVALVMLCVLAFIHVSDAALTYFLAKKGLTPKQRRR